MGRGAAEARRRRRVLLGNRAVALFLLGFLVPIGLWTVLSMGAGQLPGQNLATGFAFYANPNTSRNVQDVAGGLQDTTGTYGLSEHAMAETLKPTRLFASLADRLKRNATELLGLPVALLALHGIRLRMRARSASRLPPLLLPWAMLFIALVPIYYSNRYAAALVPAYAALASCVAGSTALAFLPTRLRMPPRKAAR